MIFRIILFPFIDLKTSLVMFHFIKRVNLSPNMSRNIFTLNILKRQMCSLLNPIYVIISEFKDHD